MDLIGRKCSSKRNDNYVDGTIIERNEVMTDHVKIQWPDHVYEWWMIEGLNIEPAANDDLMAQARKCAEKHYDGCNNMGNAIDNLAKIIYDTFKGWEAKQ